MILLKFANLSLPIHCTLLVVRAYYNTRHTITKNFTFNNPDVVLNLYNIHCCSLYGSSIWDLFLNCIQHAIVLRILFNVPRDTHRYLIESIWQCLHVKTMLASRCLFFYETIESSSKLCIRFLSNLCKNTVFSIAIKLLVKLSSTWNWKVLIFQESLNTRMNNVVKYVEGFDDLIIIEIINMLCNE